MNRSSRRKVKVLIWFVTPFVAYYLFANFLSITLSVGPREASRSQQPEVAGQIVAIEQAMRDDQYDRALTLAEAITDDVLNNRQLEKEWIVRYWENKGDVHANLWQFIDASYCYRKARETTGSIRLRWRLGKKIDRINQSIQQSNRERNLKDTYHAARSTGPAAALTGKVAIICLYVKLNNTGGWGLKDRTTALRALQIAKQWLQANAAVYGSDLKFVERQFVVTRSPMLSRISIKGEQSVKENIGAIVQWSMKALREPSVLGFLERIRKEESADQSILLLHINDRKRSFAYRCDGTCHPYYGEFAFLLEPTYASRWQWMAYAMAHESLHLFGADDLYNIRSATYYHPRDIMNYPSRFLSTSTLEGITAYAVGLLDQKPPTPFDVTEK